MGEACGLAGTGDILRLTVEPKTVSGEGGRTGGGGMRAEVGLGQGHAEGGVGREVKGGVTFAPISSFWGGEVSFNVGN